MNPLKQNEAGSAAGHTNPKRLPKLDGRLNAAFAMISPCGVCADIGADHGKLSAALLKSGRAGHTLVADVSEKALGKARKHLKDQGLEEKATFAVADGLKALKALPTGRADVVCVLGMGGDTLAGILERGSHALAGAQLVLGPHTECPLVRQTLVKIGYRLREEQIAEASNRLYVLLRASPARQGEGGYTEKELLLGPLLMARRSPEWLCWLKAREPLLQKAWEAMEAAGRAKDRERFFAVQRELAYVREELAGACGDPPAAEA